MDEPRKIQMIFKTQFVTLTPNFTTNSLCVGYTFLVVSQLNEGELLLMVESVGSLVLL